uniref:Uncharacterized protein n=1 Tax=Physcomitrium patens TaxID=3218 RepID=A0A2K1IEB1_PHYPA|nr:hypothetical protein PHYPA_029773 [Physcomitrium patens]
MAAWDLSAWTYEYMCTDGLSRCLQPRILDIFLELVPSPCVVSPSSKRLNNPNVAPNAKNQEYSALLQSEQVLQQASQKKKKKKKIVPLQPCFASHYSLRQGSVTQTLAAPPRNSNAASQLCLVSASQFCSNPLVVTFLMRLVQQTPFATLRSCAATMPLLRPSHAALQSCAPLSPRHF